jgi:hypothetical protein
VGTADLSAMRLFELRGRLCPPYARAANSDYVIPSFSTGRLRLTASPGTAISCDQTLGTLHHQ